MLQGRYLGYRQLHAVVAVVLNFHAKSELETLQSGAGRPPLGRPASSGHRLFVDGLYCLLEVDGRGLGPKHVIVRPAGLP